MRGGVPLLQALLDWHWHATGEVADELLGLRRRLLLGQPIPHALGGLGGVFADDRHSLAAIVAVLERTGGDKARAIDSVADSIERRRGAREEAAAHGSGARLSARLVAGLPLGFAPIAPLTGAPLADGPGLLLLAFGIGLGLVGLTWVSALFPRPDMNDEPAAVVAEMLAGALDAGATQEMALVEICASAPPGLEEVCLRLARFLRLGMPWTLAFGRSDDHGLVALGRSCASLAKLGLPLAAGLRSFAADRRTERARRFEEAIRRAPVRMAVPLTLCVLPSFVILGIVPFLRGLSLTA